MSVIRFQKSWNGEHADDVNQMSFEIKMSIIHVNNAFDCRTVSVQQNLNINLWSATTKFNQAEISILQCL